ncbi:ATP-binding protein [Dactylosporangium sp. NPDC051541]|uniref:ATP-binding protein n=1 Tax=Dactylosporangium sp. NPDC051541 TaxID=3363977 RepID=UPI0037948BE6
MTDLVPAPYLVNGPGRVWGWVALRVTAAVDLSRRSEHARLDVSERLRRAVGEQAAYLGQFLSLPESEAVGLRLLHLEPGRIEVYLLGRVEQPTADLALRSAGTLAATLSRVPDHVRVEPLHDAEQVRAVLSPFVPGPGGIAQVHKRIRLARPERVDAGVPAYVAVEPFGRQPHSWEGFLEALRLYPHPLAVSVELTAGTVPPQLRRLLETETTRYRRLAQPNEIPADVGGQIHMPADAGAVVIEPYYLDALRRYDGRAFRFSVTLAAPEPLPESLAGHLAATVSPAPQAQPDRDDPQSVLSGHTVARPANQAEHDALVRGFTTLQPVDWGGADLEALLRAESAPGRVSARQPLRSLRLLVDRDEAASLFRLPLALEGHVPGIPVVAPRDQVRVVAAPTGPALLLGRQPGAGAEGEVGFAVTDLPRHGFIVGTPGSGKTNTALHLCRQLRGHGVPFAVIEPVNAALDDYRWLATLEDFEDLLIFTVGDDEVAPFRLNPFQVPDGATVTSHVSNLLACFEAAFGLWDPLPFLYRRALVETYRRRGFHATHRARPADGERWPVLPEFAGVLAEVVEQLGYQGETHANIDAAARLRAEALVEGACGTTLNCRRSYDIGALMHRPVVFELAGVGDNAKEQSLITLLLVTAMRGWYRQHRRSTDTPHVVLLEEAHRVFPRAAPQTGGGDQKEGNAQALAAERIAQGLAEDRKYRQSYLLIDQQVGKVAEDAYKITNLKIMHRTAAAEDRELLGSTMAMHDDQIQAAAALRPFEAIVSHNALDQAVFLAVPDVRRDDARRRNLPEAPLADDTAVRARFTAWQASDATVQDALAPFAECFECRHRCALRPRAEAVLGGAAGVEAAGRLLGGMGTSSWFETLPARLDVLGGTVPPTPDGVDPARWRQDYRVCVFVHAFRRKYPPAVWTDNDRRSSVNWARDVRKAVDGHG